MPELGGFAEIAPYLTHPLVLAGFGLLLFFGLLRAVLKSKVMPTVSRSAGGQALLHLLRYGFVVALVVVVLGFALAFFRTGRETVDVNQIIRDFTVAKEAAAAEKAAHQGVLDTLARLSELQDSNAFRDAVVVLVQQRKNPDAPRGIERAIEMLRQGETAAAETALSEILDRALQERAAASEEAAQAARNLGAIAYLNDTAKAIEAYQTATELDPDDAWSWIYLGRLHQRAGSLAAAEQAFEQARRAAERSGDERDVGVAYHEIGMVRQAKGDLQGALDAYQRHQNAAQRLDEQHPGNAGWQRDLSVSHEKIGDVRLAQGDLAGALEAYRATHGILERLAAQDPGNAGWQRDLIVSHWKLADLAEKGGAPASEAKQHWRAALDLAKELEKTGRLAPTDGYFVEAIEARLAALNQQAGAR